MASLTVLAVIALAGCDDNGVSPTARLASNLLITQESLAVADTLWTTSCRPLDTDPPMLYCVRIPRF